MYPMGHIWSHDHSAKEARKILVFLVSIMEGYKGDTSWEWLLSSQTISTKMNLPILNFMMKPRFYSFYVLIFEMHTTYSKVNVSLNWKETSENFLNGNVKLFSSQFKKFLNYNKIIKEK